MSGNLLFILTIIAALGCGIVGGVFFAFSGFVMKSLARLSPQQGIAAMQSINIVAVTPPLMIALFGTAVVCVALAIVTLLDRQASGTGYRLAGSLLYLVGAVGVTMVFNVPLNNALATADPDSAASATQWGQYVSSWTAWNTVRTVASIAAALALTLALVAER